jgi:hypothetical protein
MAGRDDFGSGMKSPGGWSGGGGGISGGIGGAKSSGGAYNYSFMPGARPNTQAIGNWNTGGAMFGFGTPQGASDALRDMFNPQPQAPVQSGPIRPALGPQGIPASYIPQQPRPNWPPRPQSVGMANYPAQNVGSLLGRPPLAAYQGPGPGQFFDLNDYGTPPANTTTIPYNPNGGGYTNIPKNNQGNLPGYPGGNGATYNKMGSDFRSIDSW